MKVLKKRIKKKKKLIVLPKIKIKKKEGRWCQYYSGRLPFPIECSTNKASHTSTIFKGKEKTTIKNFPECVDCKRAPSFASWKRGDWNRIIQAIKQGDNLMDMDAPNKEE